MIIFYHTICFLDFCSWSRIESDPSSLQILVWPWMNMCNYEPHMKLPSWLSFSTIHCPSPPSLLKSCCPRPSPLLQLKTVCFFSRKSIGSLVFSTGWAGRFSSVSYELHLFMLFWLFSQSLQPLTWHTTSSFLDLAFWPGINWTAKSERRQIIKLSDKIR